MSIERAFDLRFISALALEEKQIQQNYRPIIAVHKWFARRPGTLFRGLLLSEFSRDPLRESFYRSNVLSEKAVADPFMGGGTPLVEANRLGCAVHGFDINPMSWWIVREEIEHLDTERYREAAETLVRHLSARCGDLYVTTCATCHEPAPVKYFLWVKTLPCEECGASIDLMPGYLLAEAKRHPKNVLICPGCGELAEVADPHSPGMCHGCGGRLSLKGPASRGVCPCPNCGRRNSYPRPGAPALSHKLFAIEYHCHRCKAGHEGRFFKKPDATDQSLMVDADRRLTKLGPRFIPEDPIPEGDETGRLHKWGMRRYADMFNVRQLLGLEESARAIAAIEDRRTRNALATNLSDLTRYQNMLCRYDTMALKSLDIFSVHGFPVGLIQCESNLLGIRSVGGGLVGSGGWANIVEKYRRAKEYCDRPFEVRRDGRKKREILIHDEWIGEHRNGSRNPESRVVMLRCDSSTRVRLPAASLDGVFTDPPYYGNVQYAELMDFCYAWLRRVVGTDTPEFRGASTRNPDELTANVTLARGIHHFTEGLASVFRGMAAALKPGAPLAFTFHHNKLEAYFPVAVAMLDSGLACSASIPCPAEMGASIHISGTGSSVVDTVFVCRSTGTTRRSWFARDLPGLSTLLVSELKEMSAGGLRPTRGDLRCVAFGHLTRLVCWELRQDWHPENSTKSKLERVASAYQRLPRLQDLEERVESEMGELHRSQSAYVFETEAAYGEQDAFFAF